MQRFYQLAGFLPWDCFVMVSPNLLMSLGEKTGNRTCQVGLCMHMYGWVNPQVSGVCAWCPTHSPCSPPAHSCLLLRSWCSPGGGCLRRSAAPESGCCLGSQSPALLPGDHNTQAESKGSSLRRAAEDYCTLVVSNLEIKHCLLCNSASQPALHLWVWTVPAKRDIPLQTCWIV